MKMENITSGNLDTDKCCFRGYKKKVGEASKEKAKMTTLR